jgi:diguanylate cyclase (GGDEF)-like protein
MELEIVTGKLRGQRLSLGPGEHSLGRSRAATLTLVTSGISRIHAMLRVDDRGRCFVRDQKSTNGTHVNGERIGIEEHPLETGDQLQLGRAMTLKLSTALPDDDDPDASYDPITGAHDSSHLASCVDRLVRSAYQGQSSLSLAVVDIDRLAELNNTHGPDVGDKALQVLAARLQEAVGERGLVVRHEEDTFVVLFADALAVAEDRLSAALHGLRADRGSTCVLFYASAGLCATSELSTCSAADLFLTALARMQAEKDRRRTAQKRTSA